MQPILFETGGALTTGEYLLGAYQWSVPMLLTGAVLTCRPPSVGSVALSLEVGGVATGTQLIVGGSDADEVVLTRTLTPAILVPANARVRWIVTQDSGDLSLDGLGCSITMNAMASATGSLAQPPSIMQVWYVASANAPGVAIYNYQSRAGQSPLWVKTPQWSGQAAVVDDGTAVAMKFGSAGASALAVASGIVTANEYVALGSVATAEFPRLEFWSNNQRLATLGVSGKLRVPDIAEAAVLTPGSGFELWSAGSLSAVLGSGGLTVAALVEAE